MVVPCSGWQSGPDGVITGMFERGALKWWVMLACGLGLMIAGGFGILEREESESRRPGDPTGFYFNRLLISDLEAGNYAQALEHAEEVIASPESRAIGYYNKACIMALMGKPEEALAALDASLLRGYNNFGHIAADPDLDPIRALPEFAEIIARYQPPNATR